MNPNDPFYESPEEKAEARRRLALAHAMDLHRGTRADRWMIVNDAESFDKYLKGEEV